MAPSLLTSLDRDGYVLIPSILTPSQLSTLRSACHQVTALARAGKWPHIRTLPKQFPPWPSDPSNGIWGVQHLNHPDLPGHDLYSDSYFSNMIVDIVKELLGCEEKDLVMELYNLLVQPDRDFELRWHRDDISETASPGEEIERLKEPAWHAQWNLALCDDSSLVVVPGSHQRARTDVQRTADPFEKHMPGQKVVNMKAGDIVFYNNNILHRGVYDAQVERMTLHGSMGHVAGGRLRARNVLQHGIGGWVERCDFSEMEPEGLRRRAEGMRKRLLDLGRRSGDVGYAHKD
ncbi:MAG: hypothetical protein M1830_004378 [Pleopsidium flavum]|nr:MAG: hypothetical protein M1830_004378 [Pleopsidium flavum]